MIPTATLVQNAIDAIYRENESEIVKALNELKANALKRHSIRAIEIHKLLIRKLDRKGIAIEDLAITTDDFKKELDKDPSDYELLIIYANELIDKGNKKRGVHLLKRVSNSQYSVKEKAEKILKDIEEK